MHCISHLPMVSKWTYQLCLMKWTLYMSNTVHTGWCTFPCKDISLGWHLPQFHYIKNIKIFLKFHRCSALYSPLFSLFNQFNAKFFSFFFSTCFCLAKHFAHEYSGLCLASQKGYSVGSGKPVIYCSLEKVLRPTNRRCLPRVRPWSGEPRVGLWRGVRLLL